MVEEVLRRLKGKCLRVLSKFKASEFFSQFQLGVVTLAGAEKVVHGLRCCFRDHWEDENFVACKIDLKNAFNEVSRQTILAECAVHFPELFRWVFWWYGQHPVLWHPMGTRRSEQGVQQGDLLGPLLFSLVLHKLIRSIASDSECSRLLFNMRYLDDGTLAGPKVAVNRAIHLIQQLGSSLGLVINMAKCELFSRDDLEDFPGDMKICHEPNLVILGAPIGMSYYVPSSLLKSGLRLSGCCLSCMRWDP